MLAVKERIRAMNRRKTAVAVSAGDENDIKTPPAGDEDSPPQYIAVSCGHLAPALSLNSQLSLLLWKYDDLKQMDKMVDLVMVVYFVVNSSQVLMLEGVWKEYQYQQSIPCPSLVLRVKLSTHLCRVVEGVEGITWEEMSKMHSELALMKKEGLETVSEEKLQTTLNKYQLKREVRDKKMTKLSTLMRQMDKLLRRVICGKGLGPIPDLEGCLRDCTTILGEELVEEWSRDLEAMVRFVMNRMEQLVDMVEMVWAEVGMENGLKCPVAKFGGKWEVYREDQKVPECKININIVQKNISLDFDLAELVGVGENTSKLDVFCTYVRGEEGDQSDGQQCGVCTDGTVYTTAQPPTAKQSDSSVKAAGCSGGGSTSYPEPSLVLCPCVTTRSSVCQSNGVHSSDQPSVHALVSQLTGLSDDQQCQPLASSTPKSVKTLSNWLTVDCDKHETAGDNLANTESESGLLETRELVTLIEQFSGVVASPRLMKELGKLDMGTGLVRWKSFERRLDEDPQIVFGGDNTIPHSRLDFP